MTETTSRPLSSSDCRCVTCGVTIEGLPCFGCGHVHLDEAQIAADAAAFSARLESMTSRREVARRDAQVALDTVGLPRGLRPLHSL